TRIFFQQMRVHGSTMGTRDELHRLAQFLDVTGTKPLIDREIPMEDAASGLESVIDGSVFGKIVLTR
ncbi:MAG: Zn-dependent oxidoreductase, partial [Actinomycetales bacterium]